MEQFGSQLGMSSYHTVFLSFLLLLGLFTGSEAFFGCFWFTCCVQCPTTTVPTVVPTVAPGVGPCINNQCPSGFACVNGQCLSAPNVYGPCPANGQCPMGICNQGQCVG